MISIILTEDNADDIDFFNEAIREIEIPIEILSCRNGAELMTILAKQALPPLTPNVIFLDLRMPKKNGFECLKEIRETHEWKELPVVIFATSTDAIEIEKTYKLGANCYIPKPTTHLDLKQLIEAALSLKLWETNHQLPKEQFVLSTAK
jgi:CheY-like chemotaxis protein